MALKKPKDFNKSRVQVNKQTNEKTLKPTGWWNKHRIKPLQISISSKVIWKQGTLELKNNGNHVNPKIFNTYSPKRP